MSGSRDDRPGLQALLKAAQEGLFDTVIIDDCSRLSRKIGHLVKFMELFEYHDITLISVADNLDTSHDNSQFMFHLKGVFNEQQLRDIRHKTRRGQVGQIGRGRVVTKLPYGYSNKQIGKKRTESTGRVRAEGCVGEITDDEAEIVNEIFDRFINRHSINAIARELNSRSIPGPPGRGWRVATISRILENET